MKTVDEIIDDVLKAEGGWVDDPADAGGATKHGLSLRYAKGIGLDLDQDGDTDKDDIRLVTPAVARLCYKRDFFHEPGIDRLPAALHPQMVDIAVNSGAPRAIMLLQHTLNSAFLADDLDVDGRMGKRTRTACVEACDKHGWESVNNLLVQERKGFLVSLVESRPSQSRFLKGWLARAESFRV